MNIIARIPVVAADHARLTVRVPMPEPCVGIPSEPSPGRALREEGPPERASEPPAEVADLQTDAPTLDEPGLANRTPDKPRLEHTKPRSKRDEATSRKGARSGGKSAATSKPKSKSMTWTYTPPKSSRRKAVGFPALSSVALVLLAAAVWGLAAWSDLERVDRHRRAERLARLPVAEGLPSERVLR